MKKKSLDKNININPPLGTNMERSEQPHPGVHHLKRMVKCMMKSLTASEEKGVHAPAYGDSSSGQSKAGINSNTHQSTHANVSKLAARREHKKVLEEIRSMPKPKLTRAELEKDEQLMKPYKSDAQRKWAHTPSGTKALGGESHVKEWDKESKGKKLPEHVAKSKITKTDLEKDEQIMKSLAMGKAQSTPAPATAPAPQKPAAPKMQQPKMPKMPGVKGPKPPKPPEMHMSEVKKAQDLKVPQEPKILETKPVKSYIKDSNPPPLVKDNVAHKPGSPEERSHAVAEGIVPMNQAISQFHSDKQVRKFFSHLRSLKEQSQQRSPENDTTPEPHVHKPVKE